MSKSFFKVRQKSTGLFYTGKSGKKRWNTGGKVYDSFNALYADWKQKIEAGIDYTDLEVVEYPVDCSCSLDIAEVIDCGG